VSPLSVCFSKTHTHSHSDLHLSLYSFPVPHTGRIKIEKQHGRGGASGAIHITNPIRRGEIEAEEEETERT